MSLKQVIKSVLEQHPELNVSRIDTAIAATETNRVEGILDPIITANVIVSDEKTPTVSDFQPAENRIGQLSGSISKALASGGTIGADFNYIRTSQGFNSPFAAQLALFNPSYRNQININYRHPLLKGSDRPDYNQALISAEAGLEQAKKQKQVIAHNLALQVINAYYQLASDDINIDIARQAVKRAKRLLAYQRSRERFGLIERADRLQAEALLAARNTDLQRSLSQRLNNQNTLNRLMLHQSSAKISVQRNTFLTQQITKLDGQSITDSLSLAERLRPELQVFEAQMQAANAQLMIALDADQLQLDIVATLGTRALDKTPLPAVVAGLSSHDHFASISLELSDALGRGAVNAGIRKAELQRQRIEADRTRVLEQIKDDISAAQTAITAAIPTLAVARQQVKAEQRKFNAEMKRYRQGRSDTATLVQFEGELRNADLNAQLQQLTIELAQTQLAWAQGRLLYDFNIMLLPENMAGLL
ncbi:MAG: TolC family protein [Mariprofundus sp.]|nr:TolC family protein [Mariprofundus sp.]